MKTILCLTDFSSTGNHAVKYGYEVAKLLEAKVIFCNVINIPAEIPQYEVVLWPPKDYGSIENDTMEALEDMKKSLEAHDHSTGFRPPITCICETGIVTNVINLIINQRKIDLIIIGTHASSGLKHLLLGNHTRYLIDSATIPLLLVPPKIQIHKISWVAFATDFSAEELGAADKLIKLIQPLNLELTLMHIINKKRIEPLEIKQQQDQFITQLSNNLGNQKISCKSLLNKSVADGLEELCAENEQHGWLAIVHKNRNFINEILKGSQTQKVAKQLSLPLLVLPPTEPAAFLN
ncbi:Nucleotide-binding universal stress protein, UspA family [Pedobacter sp. ok626]|uniref:universal stress protein n=1 Tax=Pedobacter sp. ok626 TaxID=1761882 RepID=UPI00089227F6|nr:universal stress protein [Pedobacter sp. ok626]SDJ02890.1 Nucleotide-binding universal stress protein, UspA family [Pedobacter sp. ok626]